MDDVIAAANVVGGLALLSHQQSWRHSAASWLFTMSVRHLMNSLSAFDT